MKSWSETTASASRQPVEEGGLPGVRVAHQSHHRNVTAPAGLAPGRPLAADVLDLAPHRLDPLADPSAVGLQLGLPRAPGPDAAAQPREQRSPSPPGGAGSSSAGPAPPGAAPPGSGPVFAKMSRMSWVRSMVLISTASSTFLCWAGDSSSSNIRRFGPALADQLGDLLQLPATHQGGGVAAAGAPAATVPRTSAPALSASRPSSARDSSVRWRCRDSESQAHEDRSLVAVLVLRCPYDRPPPCRPGDYGAVRPPRATRPAQPTWRASPRRSVTSRGVGPARAISRRSSSRMWSGLRASR